jgi:hypothetical protein
MAEVPGEDFDTAAKDIAEAFGYLSRLAFYNAMKGGADPFAHAREAADAND